MKTLEDLFYHELKDLHSAENQLKQALPRLIDAVNADTLKEVFEEHVEQNSSHLEHLAKICDELQINTKGVTCKAMEGLIKECDDMIAEDADPEVKDAGLIACIQRVEHYKIAGYGTARHFAKHLGHHKIAETLEEILQDEKSANDSYNDIAIEKINESAM